MEENTGYLVHQLNPGTVLKNKYRIDIALGEGGFGITYKGTDMTLDMPIAIKEFYPHGYANRNTEVTNNITITVSESDNKYINWKNKFLQEARILAKCSNIRSIVMVHDYFEENNTAYIVMEYLEGITLRDYIDRYGAIHPDDVISLMTPVLKGLNQVHKLGLIHRDISPDNIMYMPDGNLKLFDFGASRMFENDNGESKSIVLKPGYAPEEQYRSKGNLGPWTDIYSVCATMYKCITGITPDDSTQRAYKDDVKRPSALGFYIRPFQENTIMKGLSVWAKNRYQSVGELVKDLNNGITVEISEANMLNEDTRRKIKRKHILVTTLASIISVLTVLFILFVFLKFGLFGFDRFQSKNSKEMEAVIKKKNTDDMELITFYTNKDTSNEEYNEFKNSIDDKISEFAGNTKYYISKSDKKVQVLLDNKLFENADPGILAYTLLAADDVLTIKSHDEDELKKYEIKKSDIKNISIARGKIESLTYTSSGDEESYALKIKFNDNIAEKINNLEKNKENNGIYIYDEREIDTTYTTMMSENYNLDYNGYCLDYYKDSESDNTFYIQLSQNQCNSPQIYKLLKYNIENEEKGCNVSIDYEIPAKWISTNSSEIKGKNQCDIDELKSKNNIIFTVNTYTSGDDTAGKKMDRLTNIIQKLDYLDQPYVIGKLEYNDESYVVKTGTDRIGEEFLKAVINDNVAIKIQDEHSDIQIPINTSSLNQEEVFELKEKNGKEQLIFRMDGYTQSEYEIFRQKTEKLDGTYKNIIITVNDIPIMTCKVDDDSINKKEFVFDKLDYGNSESIDKNNEFIVKSLIKILTQGYVETGHIGKLYYENKGRISDKSEICKYNFDYDKLNNKDKYKKIIEKISPDAEVIDYDAYGYIYVRMNIDISSSKEVKKAIKDINTIINETKSIDSKMNLHFYFMKKASYYVDTSESSTFAFTDSTKAINTATTFIIWKNISTSVDTWIYSEKYEKNGEKIAEEVLKTPWILFRLGSSVF